MRVCDRFAVRDLGIHPRVLMENAGCGAVQVMERLFGSFRNRTVTVVCGKGKNGGDGLVVARHLHAKGAFVTVATLFRERDISGDTAANYRALLRLVRNSPDDRLQIVPVNSVRTLEKLSAGEFLVDAIFGIGFRGQARGLYLATINWINSVSSIRVSLDVPSGLNADDGTVSNSAVKANVTLTMGLKKAGLSVGAGRTYAGAIHVINLGFQAEACLGNGTRSDTFLVEPADIRSRMPRRAINSHKYSVGKLVVIAGSTGLSGAAAMASAAALRTGAGAVVLATPRSVYPILARKLTEVMVEPMPETPDGTLALAAERELARRIEWADIVLLGPGLSKNQETIGLVNSIVSKLRRPTLIDADALNALSVGEKSLRFNTPGNIILTPHVGEFSRLAKIQSRHIELHRIEAGREFSLRTGVTLVLKGAPTITATPDGRVVINQTGNPGMATAGSGDILSGIIAGLWGQQSSPGDAAMCGVYLHGRAGDISANIIGEKSLLAMDLLDSLPRAVLEVEGE